MAAAKSVGGIGRDPSVGEGIVLLEQGDWAGGRRFFEESVARERTPEALEGLGLAAWLQHDVEVLFEAREAAHDLFRSRGDRLGASRLALWLAFDSLMYRGQPALANGWIGRARTLLTGVGEEPEHGWLEFTDALLSLMIKNDAQAARQKANLAVELARRTGDTSLEAIALSQEGLALATTGSVSEGMSKLDEAATACLAGEVREVWKIATVLCNMMDACDRVRDWDRAREWFGHVSAYADKWQSKEFYAICRPHYAVVLTWCGHWGDAETELQLAIEDMMAWRPLMATEGIVRLAELRWRQGRWDEAGSLFDRVKAEPLAQLGQASLLLDQGETSMALELVERCLRRLPRDDRLERMPALELYIRACPRRLRRRPRGAAGAGRDLRVGGNTAGARRRPPHPGTARDG